MTELRVAPRISVNKLAEYLTATPARRRRLILDQIDPPAFKVKRYEHALPSANAFLCDHSKSVNYLIESAARLRDRASGGAESAHVQSNLVDSARALEAFALIANDLRFRGLVAVPARRRDGAFEIAGVTVSVRPEAYLTDPSSEQHVGAIKFHTSRTGPLNTDSLRYAAAIVYTFCRAQSELTRARACVVVDVFAGRIEVAPRAVKARLREVSAACEEIVQRWPQLLRVARRTAQARRDSSSAM